MAAAVFRGKDRIGIEEKPIPACGANDAVIKVALTTTCGTCFYCQSHCEAQCSGHEDEWQMIGGWRLGNSIDGCQAEYVRVPYAMRRQMEMVRDGRLDLEPLITHHYALDQIEEAYGLFGNQRDDVSKVAIKPQGA